MSPVRAALLSLLVSSCGSPPPAAEPTSPSASPATSAAPSSAPAASRDAPTAKVLGAAVSDKDDKFTRVTVTFENKTPKTCAITSYVVVWEGGSKEFPLDDVTLAPGESKTRAARVHWGEGDITRLTGPEGTHVDVRASCK